MYGTTDGEDESLGDLGYNGYAVYLNYFTALPDPSILADSSLTILFKSLLKKDSITKEKSLNDLLQLLDKKELTAVFQDELTIMAWIQLYPKLSIENTKNIRALSHQVQGKLLSTVGGRAFSKYLKSSVPVWLNGMFDNEKSVSTSAYKTLLSSFQNDNDRVATKIWVIFFDQILNFMLTAVTIETPDSLSDSRYTNESDAESKYERLLNGSLQMLIKTVGLVNDGSIVLTPSQVDKLQLMLENDELWAYLGTSCSMERLNIGLFKTLLVLLKVIFATPLTGFTSSLQDSAQLYKHVSKRFIKNVNFKSNKNSTIVFSSVMLQFWDTLIVLTQFDGDKNFWDLGGSKSGSRFIDYLRLGPCNSSEVYYILIRKILTILPSNTVVDFASLSDYEKINDMLCKQLTTLTNMKFAKECITSLLFVAKQFSPKVDKLSMIPGLKKLVFSSIEVLSKRYFNDKQAREDSAVDIAKVLNDRSIIDGVFEEFQNSAVAHTSSTGFNVGEFVFSSQFDKIIESYFILAMNFDDSECYENFISRIVDELSSKKGDLKSALTIIESYVDVIGFKNPQVVKFFGGLMDTKDSDLVAGCLELYYKYLNSGIMNAADKKVSVNKIFKTISSTNESYLSTFISSVAGAIEVSGDLESYPEIHSFLIKLSKMPDLSLSDSRLCFSYSNNPEIFNNLLNIASLDRDHALRFISIVVKDPPHTLYERSDDLNFVVKIAFEEASDKDCITFINLLRSNVTDFKSIVWKFITSSTISTEFVHIASCLEEPDIPLGEMEEVCRTSLNRVSRSLLSISNPLEQNIYLVDTDLEYQLNDLVLVIGKFVVPLLQRNKIPRLFVLSALISEYIGDYLFLEDSNKYEVEELLHHRQQLNTDYLSAFHNIEADVLVKYLAQKSTKVGDEIVTAVLDLLSQHIAVNDMYGFYSTRAIKSVLDVYFDKMATKQFEELDFDFYSLVRSPLLLAAMLTSCSKFITSEKFNRVRNYVAAEILGARNENQVQNEGLKLVTLCTNFYQSNSTFEVIPPHRLRLVINHISKWMESDYAYEPSFIKVRVQVVRFLIGLVLSGSSLPDNFWELTSSIIDDNLGIAVTEPSQLDLRYFTIKLYSLCYKEAQLENTADLKTEVLDLFTNGSLLVFDTNCNNQPVYMYYELLSRVLSNIDFPTQVISKKDNDLYRVFHQSTFVDAQRTAVDQLHRIVLDKQQDLVLEYQLRQSNLDQESSDDDVVLMLPTELKEEVSQVFHGEIDNHISHDFTRYVWGWYLVFTYFENVTYSIRNEYVKQLVALNAFESLFDFIFNTLVLSDQKLLRMLTSGDVNKPINVGEILINNYSVSTSGGQSLNDEMAYALVHIYYLSLKYSGSQVQQWFNSIRDRQLKQQVEKFTVKFVAPLLISKILQEATEAKPKLEGKDENLTLKVNSVTNEIKSIYIIDEQTMEMVIKIPALYPLENVTVEGPTRLGVKENQWKAWLLASQRVISLTNGSVIDAVELFNKNVNLHFSGFEDCAICYSILHQDLSLPSKVCPTCSNKFHAACLYKWFKSSNSSTCPLCRSAFNFRNAKN